MRSLVDQIKTSSEGLSNMTQQFIANLSDTMLIYLNYYPSLHKVEAFFLNKTSDIDFEIKKIEYEGIIYTSFYSKVQHNQKIVVKQFSGLNQVTMWTYFNPLVIFKIMNNQYYPTIMHVDINAGLAALCDKTRSNPVLINQDMVYNKIPVIKTDELQKLVIYCIRHNTVDIKLFRKIYRFYCLNGHENIISRIIPIHALLQ